MSDIHLSIEGIDALALLGPKGAHLNILRRAFPEISIGHRGHEIKLSGEKKTAQKVKGKIELMIKVLKDNKELSSHTVKDIAGDHNPFNRIASALRDNGSVIVYGNGGKKITARTRNQKKMVELSDHNDILFALGPAGTGKTYTAVSYTHLTLPTTPYV